MRRRRERESERDSWYRRLAWWASATQLSDRGNMEVGRGRGLHKGSLSLVFLSPYRPPTVTLWLALLCFIFPGPEKDIFFLCSQPCADKLNTNKMLWQSRNRMQHHTKYNWGDCGVF